MSGATVLRAARWVDVDAQELRKDACVVVEGDRITAVDPSDTPSGSLPHSNGWAFTGVSRLGAIKVGMKSSAPATAAAKAKTIRIVP